MKILGIDYGNKKIGLAIGDSEVKVAAPLEVIENIGNGIVEVFKKLIEEENIDLVVVGLPFSADGHPDSKQLKRTQYFIEKLRPAIDPILIETEDEAFTTVESLRLQEEEGAQADEDALAAMLILKQYFDR